MDKPEILRGDVKEFIEVYYNDLLDGVILDYNYVAKFYSQPFKPAMVNYFGGWENDESPFFDKGRNVLEFYGWDSERCHIIGLLSVKTLSQFITNCIQAGIKLTWKEITNG